MIILLLIPLLLLYVIIGIVFGVCNHRAKKLKPWEIESQEFLRDLFGD